MEERGMVQERLDRFVCNEKWKIRFTNFRVVHLPRIKSDHYPVMLQSQAKESQQSKGPQISRALWLYGIK